MRRLKSAKSAAPPPMPVRTPRARRFVRAKPIASSDGTPRSSARGGRASAAARGATGCAASRAGVSAFSQAFLYGVNTENGLPASERTSSRSKITWSLVVTNEMPRSASSCATAASRSIAAGS